MADPPNHTSPYTKMSIEELVACCLDNERPAWQEFFRRFIPCIKYSIRKTLEKAGQHDLVDDIDVISDIHNVLAEKLYKKGKLYQCNNLAGIQAWLITIAHNQTIGWLRSRGTKKNLPKLLSEKATTSLATPVGTDSEKTLADYVLGINDPPPESGDDSGETVVCNEKTGEMADALLEIINQIDKPKKKWVIRLCLLAYAPLSSDEIEEIIYFSPLPRVDVLELLDSMKKDVKKKESEKEADGQKASLYFYEIKKMEFILSELEKAQPDENDPELIELIGKLKKKRDMRDKCLASSKKMSRPYNHDIGRLVGIPEDKVGQITNIFDRGRKELARKLSEL